MSGVCLTSLLYLTSSNAAGPEEGPEEADTLRHDTQKEIRETFTEREPVADRHTQTQTQRKQETQWVYQKRKEKKHILK